MSEDSAYAQAGVDVAGEKQALAGLLTWVQRTHAFRPKGSPGHVRAGAGYFAAVVELTSELSLALAADGVGTKLLVAQLTGRYDTVGVDLVAMNVNDLVCVGAEPIALLDYVAVEGLDAAMLEALGRGLHAGAAQAGISIPGGELAQIGAMLRGAAPGKAFDLAAVAVGTVAPDAINDGSAVRPGDVVVALGSSGIHSNGLSLARQALLEDAGLSLADPLPGGDGESVGDALLEPTRIYVKPALQLLRDPGVEVTALAHITGGGFANMRRIQAPCGYTLVAIPAPPPVFQAIAAAGRVPAAEMFQAFNMGVGFTVTVRPGSVQRAIELATMAGIPAWVMGLATDSPERVITLPTQGLRVDDGGIRAVDAL